MEPRALQPKSHAERHRHKPPSEIGHWTRTLGALAPLLITEFVKDPEQRWRFIRVASVALAVLNEGQAYSHWIQYERREAEEKECQR
jgi:hypothetical protein